MAKTKSAKQALATLGPGRLESLIQALGTSQFAEEVVRAAENLAGVRHVALIAFDDQLIPHVVASASIGPAAVAKAAGKVYERYFYYRHDPNVQALRRAEGDEPLLLRLKAREIEDAKYRSNIYERFGLVDRLSILHHGSGRWLALNCYRDRRRGEFDTASIASVRSAARVLAALMAKHFALLPPAAWQSTRRPSIDGLESLVRNLDSRLTMRQVQVCARALLGMTNVAVGLDLGIQVPTVATLRKRAYSVLGISSLNELFALCLARSSHDAATDS